ncbi:acyltransferase [Clostridium gasigenes]|uniref:acyltransferase n=1 Tax=Clostridium gasigenes TaxID=94869 RepID=UPI001C0B2C85|nr:acyltransferase [Clostridium gasigenes]MBU3138157.1 acyltransferase [Clostridium gasigenes]
MNKIKQKIKIFILRLKLYCKYRNFNMSLSENIIISRKAKIILGENSKLVIGKNVYISDNSRLIVHNNSTLILEDNVYVSINSIISSNSSVIIGKNTSIAHNTTIIDTNKKFEDINIRIKDQGIVSKSIYIGEDCWLATGVVVLPGVTLGRHCIVGANSVVSNSFEGNCVLGGVPAKIIRKL